MSVDDPKMSKAERLELAAIVAPVLRSAAVGHRVLKKYNQADFEATGRLEATGFATVSELHRSLLLRQQIEIDVQPGVKPDLSPCKNCGRLVACSKTGNKPRAYCEACLTISCESCGKPLNASGIARNYRLGRPLPRQCADCNPGVPKTCSRPLPTCRVCGTQLNRHADIPSRQAARGGQPPSCKRCKGRDEPIDPAARVCADCGKKLGPHSMTRKAIARREGRPPRCSQCHIASVRPVSP